MRRVTVHVDRLVLNGFPAAERPLIAHGVRRELAKLFAEPSMVHRASLVSGSAPLRTNIRLAGPDKPSQLGRAATRAIAKGSAR
jgi:hypothetical protein